MEYGQKVVWWLFIITMVGVIVALSQYIFPWYSIIGKKTVNVSTTGKPLSQPVISSLPTQKPIPNVFYTKKQVALHNTTYDCWFILSGQVYNLSALTKSYKQMSNISKLCGTDITQTINPILKQYGIKDVTQLTSVMSQYAVGRIR